MSNPFFLSKNYISADDTINVSSRDPQKIRIYDQIPSLQWQSSGETGETGYDTYIEIILYEGINAIDRTIDTLVLQNMNFKKFKFQYWTGGAYSDIPGTEYTVNTFTSLRIKLDSSITTAKIKLLIWSTIDAGEEKAIGQLWVLLEQFEVTEGKNVINRLDYKEGGMYYLASGKLESYALFKKYAAKIAFEILTLPTIVLFKTLYDTDENFVFYQDYEEDIDGIYNVIWKNTFAYNQDTIRKYFKLNMELSEQ